MLAPLYVHKCFTSTLTKKYSDVFKRYLLYKQCGLNVDTFAYESHGKPYVSQLTRRSIYFNISHSGNYIVGAVAPSPIGIDIEKVMPLDFSVSQYVMTSDEKKRFQSLQTEQQKLDYFYKIWTVKEAYTKMLGIGLSMNLTKVYLTQRTDCLYETPQRDVTITTAQLPANYRLAISANQPFDITFVDCTMEHIIHEMSNNTFAS